jgi:septal ring factor EnvC (AmiA/AmiB activator)
VRARHPGRRLFGYFFFAVEEKVTRSPQASGGLARQETTKTKRDYTRLVRASRVIRYANVRSGILPPRSVFTSFAVESRRDDERRVMRRSPQVNGNSPSSSGNRQIALITAMVILTIGVATSANQAQAQSEPAAHSAQEAQTRQKLDDVRTEIRKISDAQKEIGIKKNDAVAALREQELKIAATAKDLRALDQKLAAQQDKLTELQARRDALNVKLAVQREALAALLRSTYALGNNEELKLLLAQEDSATIARMLAYFRYFEHARVGEIDNLLNSLQALAQVQTAIDRETAELKVARDERLKQALELDAERSQRRALLSDLDAQLKDEQARLAALGKDEKSLVDLLEKLRDVFADIPKDIAGAEPFAQLRGRLNWPLRGKLAVAFGAKEGNDRSSNGVVIAAAEGSEVHAVSHGRVVFADWMRGFGLLLIVDHGDGFLSLYGYNETLLKDVGDWVGANEAIASSGVTGGQKTPGVYFELRAQGRPVDPRAWLRP